jgi:hypothetical protein
MLRRRSSQDDSCKTTVFNAAEAKFCLRHCCRCRSLTLVPSFHKYFLVLCDVQMCERDSVCVFTYCTFWQALPIFNLYPLSTEILARAMF